MLASTRRAPDSGTDFPSPPEREVPAKAAPMADQTDDLIGDHESIHELRRLVERVARSPARTVLIYGETGTGKGLAARLIHRLSARRRRTNPAGSCAGASARLPPSARGAAESGRWPRPAARGRWRPHGARAAGTRCASS